jgi:L-seryl-tRNA(Ser) seleniumtransferase
MSTFRVIPSIEQLLQRDAVRALAQRYGREAVTEALRGEADSLRQRLGRTAADGPDAPEDPTLPADTASAIAAIEQGLARRLQHHFAPSLRAVINATGVIIHTNLGRAPLPAAAVQRVADVALGYANLEYDLDQGQRGARDVHTEALLTRLTGAPAAVVVNNNAAATLILLSALAAGREVVISRGELVEIGGGFRIPEVMAQSGAILREVGTTNKTRLADYATAIGERTALILRVHRSNFRISGFTEQPRLDELVALGRERGIPVAEDLGSGRLFVDRHPPGGTMSLPGATVGEDLAALFREEPVIQASVRAGLDVICFSGDKLLGGPQAGILIGRADLIGRIRKHPLMRALRVDKMTYAALEATLAEYLRGGAAETVPVLRMAAVPANQVAERAQRLAARLSALSFLQAEIVDGVSVVGGGCAPGITIPTRLLSIASERDSPDALERRLRRLDPPVIARVENDRVVLDLRTVLPEQDDTLTAAMLQLAADARQA